MSRKAAFAVAAPVTVISGVVLISTLFLGGGPGIDGGASQALAGSTCTLFSTSGPLDASKVATLAYRAGWRGDQIQVAVAIARAESGWNPLATNANTDGSTDFGLFQINSIHGSILAGGRWQDPADNAAMAFTVWQQAGGSFSPWVTYWDGAYRQYLDDAAVQSVSNCNSAASDPGDGPQGADMLVPRAENIKALAQSQWGVTDIGGYAYRPIAGTHTLSDHATGHAVDIMLGSDYQSARKRAEGQEISRWFAENAQTLGIKYVIYYDQINTGTGWRPYRHPGCASPCSDPNLRHLNHVHVSVN